LFSLKPNRKSLRLLHWRK